MTSRKIIAPFAIVLALGLLASCGDDAKKSISKTEFLTKGNALCTTLNAKLAEEQATIVTQDDAVAFVTGSLVPELRGTLRAIESLGFPKGDEVLLQGLIDDTDTVLDGAAADPNSFVQSATDPFAAINEQLRAYGLTVCGQDE